ncbi:hypothetical protein TIFTF001_042589, partial [Ficus carica]
MNGATEPSSFSSEVVSDLKAAKEEIAKLREEAQANKDHMLQYKSIAQVNEDALKQMESAHEDFKVEAEKLKTSLEAELVSLREKVSELENESSLKSEEVASAAAGKEEAFSSALAEIRSLKEETSAKASQIVTMEIQISVLKEDLEKEHQRWSSAQANYERHVILLSETIQELNKTSKDLGSLQDEASALRKMVHVQKRENNELKMKWETEKAVLEESKSDAEKKYNELNEQNKILHSRLEAFHIQLAEKDRISSGLSSGSTGPGSSTDAGLQNVINYLRRSKEIAETEISLLKQEKLRLQAQVESAQKATETAESALQAERASSRSFLFTEEEMKSFQLQAREMTLLRESNVQLREENKHNFEECQKLREVAQKANAETQNLDRLLKESQIQVESCKKEIQMQKLEKENLEKRVSELLERCRNIDVNEYNRLKDDVRQMQEILKEKDSQIEENKRLLSERQETISQLEQTLSNSRLELTEGEKRINDSLQLEASLKSEVEKQKKIVAQLKRRLDVLSKEKEELNRENQALTKQLEEFKQAKRPGGDNSGDQAMKEEKDTKIQILEKHLERLREELKAEKGKRVKNEKLVKNSYDNVEQEKTKFVNEFEKHKQVSMRLADELEKLKPAKESLPEGISLVQQLSGTALDDRVNAYFVAVENFGKTARAVSSEPGALTVPAETSTPVDPSVPATTGLVAPAQPPSVASFAGPATSVPARLTEESEKRYNALKANVESRKTARRLVRPRLVRPEEQPQGDTEMSEAEGANNSGKTAPSSDTETQGNPSSLPQTLVRKRQASSSAFGSHEESVSQGETGSDVVAPLTKKSKGSDSPQVSGEGKASATVENLETLPVIEESTDVGDGPQASNEDAVVDAEKEEVETTEDKVDESREPPLAEASQVENSQNDDIVLEENLERASGKEMVSDDVGHDQADIENQQSMLEIGNEREEGELVPDAAELEGTGGVVASPELVVEGQPEPLVTPVASPVRVDDEAVASAAADVGDISSQDAQNDEKNDEVDEPEEIAEGSEKSNDGNDQAAVEIDQVAEAASVAPE